MTGYGQQLDRFKAACCAAAVVTLFLGYPPRLLTAAAVPAVVAHIAALSWVAANPNAARAHIAATAAGVVVWLPAAFAYAIEGNPSTTVALVLVAAATGAYDIAAVRRIAFFERHRAQAGTG